MKTVKLTDKELWILWYGGYKLSSNSAETEKEFEIDLDTAIAAEKKTYEELIYNDSLLMRFGGYRERRLNRETHQQLKNKLRLLYVENTNKTETLC